MCTFCDDQVKSMLFKMEDNIYTGCPRRNVLNFGRVFLMLNYTDITQNTYIQCWTITEIMAIEKCGLRACSMQCTWYVTSLFRVRRLQGEGSKMGGELLFSCATGDCINFVPSQGLQWGNEVPDFHLLLAKKYVVPCHFFWARWDEIPFPVTLHNPLPR